MEETMRVLTLNELMRLTRNRALRSRGTDHQRLAGLPGRLAESEQRASQPAQYPLRSGAARFFLD